MPNRDASAAISLDDWQAMTAEAQDELIAAGWHPGLRRDWSDVNARTRRVWIVREGVWAERVPLETHEYAALVDELAELRLYKLTVTKSADSPITEERPRDVGAPGAVT